MSAKELDECLEEAEVKVKSETMPELKVPPNHQGQNFVVMSIVGPHCRQQADQSLINILGTFATLESAQAFSKEVAALSPAYDLFCASTCSWLPANAKPEDAESCEYRNERQDELLREYHKRRALTQAIFEKRTAKPDK